jgi:ribosomal protein L16 Arg81 hydroxylase
MIDANAATVQGFDELLAPFDRARFFAERWGKESIIIEGSPDKFSRLPGLKELPAILNGDLTAEGWIPGPLGAATVSFIDKQGQIQRLSAPATMWPRLFNSGFSICFGPVESGHPELRRYIREFSAETTYPGKIVTTCYLTPPGSGYTMHFDSQHNFLVQVSGEKHWTFGTHPAVTEPPTGMSAAEVQSPLFQQQAAMLGITVKPPAATGMQEKVLKQGDVLYMPPGVWHAGRTQQSHSFHYTLTFEPMTPFTMLQSFFVLQLLRTPSWRTDLRFPQESGGPARTELISRALNDLRDAIVRLTPDEVMQLYAMSQASEGLRELTSGKLG